MLVATLFACGCEGNVLHIASLDEEKIKDVKDYDLCKAYGTPLYGRTKKMKAEIVRRNLFTAEDLDLIDERKVRIGGPELMIPAAWGQPTTIHETRTRRGMHRQWVYRISNYQHSYAYSDNGIVTSTQN
ncbi:MAG: hypothetical protein HS101_11415 [Planctomycetia bacterium]|jgi:hypothetical protein|nr:hypothetical protein [Planctomycetia bacterium]MCC7316164.1 hypothetical protein [Planctomycetota bacterium]